MIVKPLLIILILVAILFSMLPASDVRIPSMNKKQVDRYLTELRTSINSEQSAIMVKVYNAAIKYDVVYTAIAICWEESKFGLYTINNRSKDYGIMGINLMWYMIDKGLNYKSYWKRMEVSSKLVRDDDFNIAYSIDRILYWNKISHGNWFMTWARYNGGKFPNDQAYRYANRILNRIIAFKRFIKEYQITKEK